jgi:FkbM family methyltransferase
MGITKRQDLIFDVGLHRGEDTDLYLRKGFQVVAFEADPEHASFCRQRFSEYIEQGKLTIIEGAIVDPATLAPGVTTISFYKNDGVSVWGTICDSWAERNVKLGAPSRTVTVSVVDFAGCLRMHGIPHYLKIDIEGCDLVCVKALQAFDERPNYLSIESDKTSFRKVREEIDLLANLGYKHFQAVEQSAVVLQKPPRPAKEGEYVEYQFTEGASGLFGEELPGSWQPKHKVLRHYRLIRIGYILLGEDGILTRWRFKGAGRLRRLVARCMRFFIKAEVPGWYDTHARLS